MLSAGSLVSVSVTLAATTVTLHVAPNGNGDEGVSVKLWAGVAVTVNDCGVEAGHSSANAAAGAFTPSLKLPTIDEDTGTADAPPTGVVEVTVGAGSIGVPSAT